MKDYLSLKIVTPLRHYYSPDYYKSSVYNRITFPTATITSPSSAVIGGKVYEYTSLSGSYDLTEKINVYNLNGDNWEIEKSIDLDGVLDTNLPDDNPFVFDTGYGKELSFRIRGFVGGTFGKVIIRWGTDEWQEINVNDITSLTTFSRSYSSSFTKPVIRIHGDYDQIVLGTNTETRQKVNRILDMGSKTLVDPGSCFSYLTRLKGIEWTTPPKFKGNCGYMFRNSGSVVYGETESFHLDVSDWDLTEATNFETAFYLSPIVVTGL